RDWRHPRLLLERSDLSVCPNRGKCISLTGLRINASMTGFLCIGLWIRAYRQHMLPGAQHRVVTLIKPQIRHLDTVDEQVNGLDSSKIGCLGHNQTSVMARTGRRRIRSDLSRLNWRAYRKTARDCYHDQSTGNVM